MRLKLTRLLALLISWAVLLPALPAKAETLERVYLAMRYDLDRPDANPFFCVSQGQNGSLGSAWAPVPGKVITSGSSTTVTAQDAVTEVPFRDLAVGDVLKVRRVLGTGTVDDIQVITAKASSTSLTVENNVNWQNGTTGYTAFYRKPVCGQTAANGWFSVANWIDFTVIVAYQQGDFGGGLDWRVECRDGGDDPVIAQVFPATLNTFQTIATAGATVSSSNALAGFEIWNECRVALLANTSDPADAAGTTLDRIRVVALGRVRQ